jgi:hypothetical protein
MENNHKCIRFEEFMAAQKEIIQRHIDEHAWCQHIDNKEEAMLDFINKFGWMFREAYCRGCPDFKDENGTVCKAFVAGLK